MTDVQPRVSTDGKLLTIAFFLAILRVPKKAICYRCTMLVFTVDKDKI
jgi:hypothetical protein